MKNKKMSVISIIIVLIVLMASIKYVKAIYLIVKAMTFPMSKYQQTQSNRAFLIHTRNIA